MLVIPFDRIPNSVIAVSSSKVTFITANNAACFPTTGQLNRYVCWTPLYAPTRFMLADENGDLFILSVIFSNDMKVADIKVYF